MHLLRSSFYLSATLTRAISAALKVFKVGEVDANVCEINQMRRVYNSASSKQQFQKLIVNERAKRGSIQSTLYFEAIFLEQFTMYLSYTYDLVISSSSIFLAID